jgi:hypothetical protein
MTLSKKLFVIAASVLLASCAIQPENSISSPSGRFKLSYGPGNQEADSAYLVTDKLGRIKGGSMDNENQISRGYYVICSGTHSPLDESKVIWSPSEMTFLVILGLSKDDSEERILLVRLNDNSTDGEEGERSEYCLLEMKALEYRFFNGKSAQIIGVSDTGVSFTLDNDPRTIEIGLDALELESQRQASQ